MALISIVVPVDPGAAGVPVLAGQLAALAAGLPAHQFEFLYVVDGPGGEPLALLQGLADGDPLARVIKHDRPLGSHTAILTGMIHARGDCVAYVPAGLQDAPAALAPMLAHWADGYQVVLAVRRDRGDDAWPARVLAGASGRLSRLVWRECAPGGVDFYLLDRQVAGLLAAYYEKDADLLCLISSFGYRYAVVPYERPAPPHGASRATFLRKPEAAVKGS